MFFHDVYGQERVKQLLRKYVAQRRLPHALLLSGNEGSGTFPLALALAQYVNCKNPTPEGEACGECRSCVRFNKLKHPDFYFFAPYAGALSDLKVETEFPLARLSTLLEKSSYISQAEWMLLWSKDGSKKLRLPVEAAQEIIASLDFSPVMGGYKVILIYLPELMEEAAANQILKTLEEPRSRTLFLLVSSHPERLLPTIRSRVQELFVPPLSKEDLLDAFLRRGVSIDKRIEGIVRVAQGSYITAYRLFLEHDTTRLEFLQRLLRMAYNRDYEALLVWADDMARLGREEQRQLLTYYAQMLREMFMFHVGREDLTLVLDKELEFAKKVSPFIDGKNVGALLHEYASAYRQVNDNCNMTIVYTDLAIRHAKLIQRLPAKK